MVRFEPHPQHRRRASAPRHKVARSNDGIRWERNHDTVIGFATPAEYAIVRPTVAKIGDVLLMCFASRGDHYQIGAARSEDYEHWTRSDRSWGWRHRKTPGTAK